MDIGTVVLIIIIIFIVFACSKKTHSAEKYYSSSKTTSNIPTYKEKQWDSDFNNITKKLFSNERLGTEYRSDQNNKWAGDNNNYDLMGYKRVYIVPDDYILDVPRVKITDNQMEADFKIKIVKNDYDADMKVKMHNSNSSYPIDAIVFIQP